MKTLMLARQGKFADRQNGGALLVSMVMIFMLSILGVSAMRGSTIERKMASNSIQTQTNFQAAESSSEIGLNNTTNLSNAYNAAGSAVQVTTDLQQGINADSSVSLIYVGAGVPEGFSTGVGIGASFSALRFVSTGKSDVDSVRAASEVIQGAYQIAPGLPSQ